MKKRRLLKSIVAMIALTAMLMENTFSVMASIANDSIIESDEAVIAVDEGSDDAITADDNRVFEVLSDDNEGDDLVTDDKPSREIDINIGGEDEGELISEAPSVTAADRGIEVTGRKDVTLYINTGRMTDAASFRLDINGSSLLEYDSELAGKMKKDNGGIYYIDGLDGKKFTVKAYGMSDGLSVQYKVREDGNPQVTLISEDDKDMVKSLRVTDSGFEVKGSGYDEVSLKLDGTKLKEATTYCLYVKTDAGVRIDGDVINSGEAVTFGADSGSARLSNLNNKAFTIYIEGKNSDKVKAEYTIDSEDNGVISVALTQSDESVKVVHDEDEASQEDEEEVKNEKRVYEYRDADVYVTATLEDPEAIPDDAEFTVTRVEKGSDGYNYEAYMEALNNNADKITGEENSAIFDDDVLLYDIAFYTEDENGNRVELQPENGSVSVRIRFRKDQLEEELGAETAADVKTVHLPLVDSVKDEVNTTAEATDITASDIRVDVVSTDASVERESVGFTLSDFSVMAVFVNGKMAPGTPETFKTILGGASEYGIVANSVKFGGHFESNVAVGSASGTGPMAAPRNEGGNAGRAFIGAYSGGDLLIDNNGNKSDFVIYTTQSALDNMSSNMKQPRTGVIIDTTTYSEETIKDMVAGMVSAVADKSESISKNEPMYKFKSVSQITNDRAVIDLTSKGSGAGTYFISFDEGEYASAKMLKIILNSDQRIVFDIPDSSVEFKQYEITIGGKQYTTNGNSDEDPICQRVIFNCPNAKKAKTVSPTAGTFVVPGAEFRTDSVAAGWVVADTIASIGGQEWHCVYHEMPPATGCSTIIEAIKTVGYATPGKDQKFWFDLYTYDFDTKKLSDKPIQSVQNNGEKVTFAPLVYNQAGVYAYVLKEREGNDSYIHDPSEYTIHVKVRLNEGLNRYEIYEKNVYRSNNLTGEKQKFMGSDYSVITFNNQDVPKVEFDFNITKLFYQNDGTNWASKRLLDYDEFLEYGFGQDWPDNATFTFDIERFNGGNTNQGIRTDGPMPDKKTITLTKDNRTGSFGKVFFQADFDASHYGNWERNNGVYTKTYMYKITERIPDDAHKVPGVFYTERPVYVKLFVESWWDSVNWCAKVQVKGRASYVNDNSIQGQECFPISNSNLEFVNGFYSGSLKVKKKAFDIDGKTRVDNDRDFYVVVYRKVGSERLYYNRAGEENQYPKPEIVKGNSEITYKPMPLGYTYYIYESDASGNQIDENKVYKVTYETPGQNRSVTFDSLCNRDKEVTINNKRLPGSLKLIKKGEKGEVLKGAEFALYKDGKPYNNTVYTTDDKGVVAVGDLHWGTYYFVETKAPTGYVLPADPDDRKTTSVTIDASNADKTSEIEMTDDKIYGQLDLYKVDDKFNALAGATFKLYKSDETKDTKVQVKTSGADGVYKYDESGSNQELATDSAGHLSVTGLPYGTYRIYEEKAPAGHNKDIDPKKFSIKENGHVEEITFINTPVKANVEFIKVDADEKPLKGVGFVLYKKSGSEKSKLDTQYSDDEGHVIFKNLGTGDYIIMEEFYEGYVDNTKTEYPFSIVEADNGKTITLPDVWKIGDLAAIVNTPEKGKAQLFKYVKKGDKILPLGDAEFDLYKDGVKYNKEKLVTGADGLITVTDLPWGSYYFIETKAPTGFVPNTEKKTFTISRTKRDFTGKARLELENTPIKGYVELLKVDEKDEGHTLSDVTFGLYKGTPDNSEGKIDSYTTDVNGMITAGMVGALEYGDYYFVEEKTVNGYKLVNEPVTFSIRNEKETIKLTVKDPRLFGKVTLEKYDSKKDKKLNGAKFELWSSNPQNAIDSFMGLFGKAEYYYGTYTTENGGVIVVDDLPWGNYFFKEIEAPKGYVFDPAKEYKFTIDAENLDADLTYEYGAVNDEEPGAIKLIKDDGEGSKLNGAKFALYKDGVRYPNSERVYETGKDGVDGEITVDDLPWGTYYFVELEAPEGFVTPEAEDAKTAEVTINELNTKSSVEYNILEKSNTPIYGSLNLRKVDDKQQPLEGAQFSLVKVEDGKEVNVKLDGAAGHYTFVKTKGALSFKQILDTDGANLSITGLPYGTYRISEETAPEGYKKVASPYEFSIAEQGVEINYDFENPLILANIEFLKKDDGDAPVEGAVFRLERIAADGSREDFGTMTSDKNGKVVKMGLGTGEYRIVEETAPDGYELNTGVFTFKITENEDGKTITLANPNKLEGEIGVVIEPKKKGSVKLWKAIEGTNTGLKGAQFSLYKKGTSTPIYTELESDDEGYVRVSDLEWGTYCFKETKAPYGYILDDKTEYAFEITPQNVSAEVTVDLKGNELRVDNTPIKGQAKLVKKNSMNEDPIEGAKFALYTADGNLVTGYEEMTTNKDGVIMTGKDLGEGSYYFMETEAAKGYTKTDTKYEFTISQKNMDEIVLAGGNGVALNPPKPGKAELLKFVFDKDGVTKKPLSGAVFTLYRTNKWFIFTSKEKVDDYETNADGKIMVENLEWGDYYFEETKAPEGYEPFKGKIEFTISATSLDFTGEYKRKECENTPIKGSVRLIKKFAVDGKVQGTLEGAKFKFFRRDNGLSTELPSDRADGLYVTDDKGQIVISSLEWGTYYFEEVEAPEGFALPKDTTSDDLIIDAKSVEASTEEPLTAELVNDKIYGNVKLLKIDDSKPAKTLAGAQFALFTEDGDRVYVTGENGMYLYSKDKTDTVITTDKDGVVKVDSLPYGKYFFQETRQPDAKFVINLEHVNFEIVKNQKKGEEAQIEVTCMNSTAYAGVEFIKADTTIDHPLEGVVFKLSKKGAAEDGSDLFITYVTSNEDGIVSYEGLTVGDYYFTEYSVPDDAYEIITTPFNFTITTNDNGKTVGLKDVADNTVINTPKKGSAEITKKYSVNGSERDVLEGAEFELYRKTVSGNSLVVKDKTDSNGKITVKDLDWGSYFFIETSAPAGYTFDPEKTYDFEINSKNVNKLQALIAGNKRLPGEVEIEKIDEKDRSKTLDGVVFKLFKDYKTNDRSLKATLTTANGGKAYFGGLEWGNYTLKEYSTIDGYVLNEVAEYNFVIDGEHLKKSYTGAEAIPNTPIEGTFELLKKDKDTNEPIPSVRFNLFKFEGTVKRFIDSYETNAAGKLADRDGNTIIGPLEYGSYILEEELPKGYTDMVCEREGGLAFKIERKDQHVSFTDKWTVYNTPAKGSVVLRKVDEDNKPLAGAKFKLYAKNPRTIGDTIATLGNNGYYPYSDDVYTTDDKGEIWVNDLAWNTYYFIETEAPKGYEILEPGKTYDFTIDADNVDKTIEIGPIGNKKKLGSLELIKEDEETKEKLEGAEFELYKVGEKEDINVTSQFGESENGVFRTSAEGLITVSNVPWGTYYFKEVKAPKDYEVIGENDRVVSEDLTIDENNVDEKTGFMQPQKTTVYNDRGYGYVSLIKKFDGEQPKSLAGVKFRLVNDSDPKAYDKILETNADGIITAEAIGRLQYGDYHFEEISVPVGTSYSISLFKPSFTISESNPIAKPRVFTFVNSEILASARVIKIDPFTGETIPGIKFGLYKEEDDSLITDIYSDEDGYVVAEHLPMGKYYFKEYADSAAGKGYLATGDIFNFEITKDDYVPKGQPEKFVTVYKNGTRVEAIEVPNPKLTGCISLEKLGKKLDGSIETLNVADGEFELYKDDAIYMDAEATAKCVSGNKIVISGLEWGSYHFKEIKAPDGYALPEGSAALSNKVMIDGTTVAASLTTPLVCQISDETIRVNISKRSITGADELKDAELELYEADASGKKTGKALLAWTSGITPKLIEVGGDVKAGVIAGKYYVIHEVKAPKNYALADDILFSVNEDGTVKTNARVTGSGNGMTIIMEDAALNISISKRELGTDRELAGATLKIMHDGETVESWSSTGKEHVIEAPLTAGEEYQLVETDPPKGYYTAEPITFTVNTEGNLTIRHDASSSAEVRTKTTAQGTAATLIMYDRPIRVEISKKRLSGTAQDYVDGAELALYEQLSDGEYKQIFAWTSQGGKPVLIDYGLLKVGTMYKVVETKAPAGFVKTEDFTFTVKDYKDFDKEDEDGLVTQKVDVFDAAIKAVFSKKSITGDEELAGAVLQVLDSEGNKVVEFKSTGKQTLVTSIDSADKLSEEEKKAFEPYDVIYGIRLEAGKSYRLHEVSSPSGYAMAEDVDFRIDENGKQLPSPVVMKDKPLEIKLSKKDIGTGAYLAGAELLLENEAGEKVAGWTSSDKPVLISIRKVEAEEAARYAEVIPVKLPVGKYVLKEVKAPEGYKIAEPVSLTIDGSDVRKNDGTIREESMYDYKEGSTSVVGKKAWIAPKDSEGNISADYKYPDITIDLYRDSVSQGQIDATPYRSVKLENGATSFAFGDLERYRTDSGRNYEYTYEVRETMSEEGQAQFTGRTLEMTREGDENTVLFMAGFENILNQEFTDLKGVKTFKLLKDKDGRLLSNIKYDDVTIYLLRNGERVDLDEDGKEDCVKITGGALETKGVVEFEFKQLPRYDLTTGNAYKYTVEETGSESYIFSIVYNEDKVNITNIPKQTPFEIRGVKNWVDPEGSGRPDVTIQLYRDGKLYKETKLNADNTFSFNGLYEYNLGFGNDEGDIEATADGHRFVYEVKESGALGYDVKITGSGADMVIDSGVAHVNITNTIKQDYVEISGSKFWNDRGDSSKRPKVTVNLYASDSTGRKDELVDTYVIPNTASKYEFGTAGRKQLPKYDANGKVISYRIGETALAGYVSEIRGNDIVNTPSKVVISKLDATEHTELPGAVLAIIRKSDNKEVERWTSGTTPHYIEALELGEVYILKEITAPAGYALAGSVEFQVGTNGVEQKVEMFDDPVIGSVTLTKYDASNREKLAGAEFSLYTKDGKTVAVTGTTGAYVYSKNGSGIKTLAVNASGELKVDKLPYGTYYFKETKAPKGYELKSETINFSITDHAVNVTVSCEDPRILGAASLLKTDSDGNALAGAEFELYSKTPTTTGQAAASTVFSDAYYRYGTYTTDSDGRIEVKDLPWDDYYFIETKAPEGYQTNRDVNGDPLVYTFSISADNAGSSAISVGTVTNEKIETGVLGERVPPAEKASGVLGVRSKPQKGVLGTRVGPATGDASAIALWLTLLVACIGTIVWMLVGRKKKEEA